MSFKRTKGDSMIIFFGLLGIFIVLGVIFYLRAVASRKVYRCPECGESFKVELMKAQNCKSCGTPVKLSDDGKITDKV